MSSAPITYQVRHFIPQHRGAMVFELVRRTPRSTIGTVTDSRVVHQGEPLSAFRQARKELLDAAPRPLSDTTPAPTVLVPVTQIVRRVGYFLRLCECGHAGRANFHNGDEGAAFELIAAQTWTCGFCQTHQPNPGRDDEEFAAATKVKEAA